MIIQRRNLWVAVVGNHEVVCVSEEVAKREEARMLEAELNNPEEDHFPPEIEVDYGDLADLLSED